MKHGKALAALAVLSMVVVASIAVYEFYLTSPPGPCTSVRGGGVLRSQVSEASFGGVTEYRLPAPDRWPNAVTTAPDGSVWFAEQEAPGVGHLFPANGTLVEYGFSGYPNPKPPDCVPSVNNSGIALWDGRVWVADEFDNRTIGFSPGDGSTLTVSSTGRAPFPYWLAVGPDGDLWFTSSNFAGQPTRLGRILPNMTLQSINLAGLGNDQPIQLDFVNSTLALLSTLNEANNPVTHACICTGHVYSFDPALVGTTIVPALVGGDHTLYLPTSASYSNGSVWVAQHGASSVERYDFSSKRWTVYPTSLVGWSYVTLPLVVDATGGKVWFNEHYANKIALIDPSSGKLTEYSESDPPPTSYGGVQNDLAIAAAPTGLWFTSLSGNYVGFVSEAVGSPGFSIAATGSDTATVAPGGVANFSLRVSGTWSGPLRVNVSDSENLQSIPKSIQITPSATLILGGSAPYDLSVAVVTGRTVNPGEYTVLVTVDEGLVQQAVYLFIVVE
jgi:streptogramin lyase